MAGHPLREAPRDLSAIAKQEESLILPHFTADDALEIGLSIRNRLRSLSPLAAVVSISLANSSNLLFHAVSRPGIQPDNDIWVSRKRKTVLRWGVSTWFMHNKFKGDEEAFSKKYMLGGEAAGTYAIHGGGVPVRVQGVEGIVGVVVVSGLKQDQDHMVVIEALDEFLDQCTKEEGRGEGKAHEGR
ncbi:uncharacterized protein Z520_05811 [Fonsecaea multimorphosa CBS 102226]|uniref:DUF967 domain protein n=1 Tax=Fonsecaea multimorphosa CBS 102226 TaxID=1442371 RepID=A0A0D2H9H7_9EURO|nr:uncharacterized protein Z520_05811 [Fonsecaea multimorphosa CBS 102226]KIX98510.1 hypothetical protein Z520_05811 [Fonsecaea multimorphosa CBS 102226]OAL24704.1 hypothetical protein AYO22_05493 [Fonsecaea multimorphosa]